jgi:hypothetical protein
MNEGPPDRSAVPGLDARRALTGFSGAFELYAPAHH